MTDADRILQDFFDHRREHGVAALDGKLDIPDLVREANLPVHLVPTLLRAKPIRYPEVRAKITQKLGGHVLFARGSNQVDTGFTVLEHPLPPVSFVDPDRGLVAPQDGRPEKPSLNPDHLFGEGGHRPLKHIADRALADLQTEDLPEQCGETLETDRLVVVEGNGQTHHRRPEWRSRFQPLGYRRQELFPAARADAPMAFNPRYHRLDRRNLNPVVDLLQRLVVRCYRCRAMRAGRGDSFMGLVRRFAQRSAYPGMRRLGPLLPLFANRTVGLLTTRRRDAGVVRRLGWSVKFRFQLRNPRLELPILGGKLTVLAQQTLNGSPQFRRKGVGAQCAECGGRRQMTHDSLNRVGKAESSRMFSP